MTILIYQNLGGAPPPPGPGMPFLDSDTCAEGEGGGGYLFLSGFSSLYDAIHGWMEKASRKTTTTSFTICNRWAKGKRKLFFKIEGSILGETPCFHLCSSDGPIKLAHCEKKRKKKKVNRYVEWDPWQIIYL